MWYHLYLNGSIFHHKLRIDHKNKFDLGYKNKSTTITKNKMVKAMLAKEYSPNDPKIDPIGEEWIASEKLDGYRCIYEGKEDKFMSRQEKPFNKPEWFTKAFPKRILDGELWISRDQFQGMGVVRKKEPIDEEWMNVTYQVYDLLDSKRPFFERVKELKRIVKLVEGRWRVFRKELPYPLNKLPCPLVFVEQIPIKSQEHLKEMYEGILAKGGEGIMLKDPNSEYEFGKRSSKLLKYKPNFDAEAMIVDYKPGKGKYEGMLGGFICKPLLNHDTYMSIDDEPNHQFSTSGMNDKVRGNYKKTHPIGTVITYEYSGKTDKGAPRFARYMRKRTDVILKEYDNTSSEMKIRVLKIMKEIGEHEKINGESFKASSYFKAIKGLKELENDSFFTEEHLKNVKGVGKSIIEKVRIIMESGTCPKYEEIKKKADPRKEFVEIYGVGPAKAKELMEMGVKSVQEMKGYDEGKIKSILNEKQQIGLKYYDDIQSRIPHSEIKKHEKFLKTMLKKVDPSCDLTIAGSYRRKSKTSGDIDVLIRTKCPSILERFVQKLQEEDYMYEELALGDKKFMGLCNLGKYLNNSTPCRRIDIMVTTEKEYPFAILYFTGSAEFNPKMRQIALDKGFSLNEYSLTHLDSGKDLDKVFTNESEIFEFLGMEYTEPKNR